MAASAVQAARSSDAASLSAGAIAGIVIGSLAFIVILISAYFYISKWRREGRRTRSPDRHQPNMEATRGSHRPHALPATGAGRSMRNASDRGQMARGEGMV